MDESHVGHFGDARPPPKGGFHLERGTRPTRARRGRPATTSEATRPAWCGTVAAAMPCATAAAAAARRASMPFAQERGDHAGEHVSAAGRGERRRAEVADERWMTGRLDDRVGALQEHHAAEALGAPSVAAARRCCAIHDALDVDQRRELTGMGRDHGRRSPLERLEPVQGVGVDARAAGRPARAAPGPGRAPPPCGPARARPRLRPRGRRRARGRSAPTSGRTRA